MQRAPWEPDEDTIGAKAASHWDENAAPANRSWIGGSNKDGQMENNEFSHHTHWNCPPSVNPKCVASPLRSLSRPRLSNVHIKVPTKNIKDGALTENPRGRDPSRKPKRRGGGPPSPDGSPDPSSDGYSSDPNAVRGYSRRIRRSRKPVGKSSCLTSHLWGN